MSAGVTMTAGKAWLLHLLHYIGCGRNLAMFILAAPPPSPEVAHIGKLRA